MAHSGVIEEQSRLNAARRPLSFNPAACTAVPKYRPLLEAAELNPEARWMLDFGIGCGEIPAVCVSSTAEQAASSPAAIAAEAPMIRSRRFNGLSPLKRIGPAPDGGIIDLPTRSAQLNTTV
tara:strand:+ start:2882 stop:3247 length:366 start_codon:yes stop_codon:yes gene_type:complete